MKVLLQVQTDEYGFVLEPMVPGQLMARHYIRFKTMVAMCNTPSPAGLPELLMTIACSAEFSSIKLRRSEKKALNAINKGSNVEGGKAHAVRFCVSDPHKPQKAKERISSGPEKIFIMVIGALLKFMLCHLWHWCSRAEEFLIDMFLGRAPSASVLLACRLHLELAQRKSHMPLSCLLSIMHTKSTTQLFENHTLLYCRCVHPGHLPQTPVHQSA